MALENAEAGKQVEQIWRAKFRQAQDRYQFATANTRRLQAEYSTSSVPPADGDFAVRNALRNENEARSEYMRVLHVFTKLILHGERPEENTQASA
jgi:hypothetical protein